MARAFFLIVCLSPVLRAPANAGGMVHIQQSDGSVQDYNGVAVRYVKSDKALAITSADGKGTLTIARAACSYVDGLYRCLPTEIRLTQNGQTRVLGLDSGTVYANTTDAPLNMPLSSQKVPPNGIVMALKTAAGTYISLIGTIDGGVK